MSEEKHIHFLVNEIQSYLTNYPQAADSLEGITRWWIQKQRFVDTCEQVESALNILISKGVIHLSENKDGKKIYRLNISS
ncbi:MAG: hypothetical protein OEY78_11980 [Gammaproteobacteria bacterium]|nr:hypothetical protein [Gammaproteobacteria bacterium]